MSEGVQVFGEGIVLIIAGHSVSIALSSDEMRHLAVALAVAADERDGKQPPAEALAILQPVEGRA